MQLSPIYLFIQSFIRISMDSGIFILCFGLKANAVLLCCSNSCFGHRDLFQLAPVILKMLQSLWGSVEHPLTFWDYKMLGLLPAPGLESGVRDQGLAVLDAPMVLLLLGPLR